MTRFTKPLFVFAAASLCVSAPAMAEDSPVVGSWDTVAKTDFGNFQAVMAFAATAEGYTVEITDVPPEGAPAGPPMESTVSDLVVDGGSFSFKRQLTTPQGPMELTYTGSVEGDALTAEANSAFGAIPVTGTRAAAE